jgi:hypothetical protein
MVQFHDCASVSSELAAIPTWNDTEDCMASSIERVLGARMPEKIQHRSSRRYGLSCSSSAASAQHKNARG